MTGRSGRRAAADNGAATTRGGTRAGAAPDLVPLRITAVSAAAVLLAQPVWAGLFITGQVSYLGAHGGGAFVALLLVLCQLVAVLVLWRPGHGSPGPVLYSVAELGLVITQMALGGARVLAVHIPLGVALIGTALLFARWACSDRGARRRGRAAR
ncbi:hypothetical protein [Pseudonocardia asaccharolytica]|uniref:Uncharacterized protein n=1 Tax=Pseudonocardia asaccharolytica DSM 44247 = NBRC 16224 TaxID=1123024 RepID=A0A511D2Q7_9PSEU|nr:hypothetical protein [Pseudonocardia asaccharolytica]GEL19069.1 hypothetical protein PA7_29060 [Pseudonocardia asaccharolytica DSM 44247 = NBRC 16224]